jgi:hypothetical protein
MGILSPSLIEKAALDSSDLILQIEIDEKEGLEAVT